MGVGLSVRVCGCRVEDLRGAGFLGLGFRVGSQLLSQGSCKRSVTFTTVQPLFHPCSGRFCRLRTLVKEIVKAVPNDPFDRPVCPTLPFKQAPYEER